MERFHSSHCTIMTGRGRPHKAKSPNTKCAKSKPRPEEMKQVTLPRCPRKDFTEKRQNGTTKEEKPKEQKKANHTEEKPSVQNAEMTKTQPGRPKDTTKDSLKTTKGKKCGVKAKSPERFSEEMAKTQPKAPKETTKVKTTEAKTCAGKAKSPDNFTKTTMKMHPETPKDTTKEEKPKEQKKANHTEEKPSVQNAEITKTQPGRPKDTTKDSLKTTKGKKCGVRAKSPEQFSGEMAKMQPKAPKDTTKVKTTMKMHPETPKDTTKACIPKDRCENKAEVDSLLYTTLEKLKIKRNERAGAAEVINEVIHNIITHLKQTDCFKEVEEPLRTGSYYENLKISNPDEFDVMLPIPVDRVDIKPFGDDGAFYSVALKRGKSPLQKFQENSILSASKMLKEFREEVKKSVKKFTKWEVTIKKKGCPAVTLITKLQSVTISLDVVLSIVVKSSWPPFTKDGLKIEGWLGAKVKQQHKRKPYYLVPKYEGRGAVENDGVLAKDIWRVSFSHIEKAIMMNHGSEKTCCEKGGARCCRKDCLKLLKHLLSLLKEKDSTFDKFCSYHVKTTFLHACCSRTKDSDWMASNLSHCFQLLLQDFVAHLERRLLCNFFIPSQNLLSSLSQTRCNNLARCISEECDKGFPIFK
ncbi:cyclic GMP-AMP synthase [Siniperca chuatsi]|uniref:cyclic GMP-AMP synthase n=1 Tax=Siniperca chuatsi TaxID=119488 RepID=UPI001CE19F61|nr:cyclic GMP-AMP synthase [Siniperca chuatsi]